MPMTINDLASQHCKPRKAELDSLDHVQSKQLIGLLPGWHFDNDQKAILKTFKFSDFYKTLSFINMVGFLANQEDHHPDIAAGYGHCQVAWSTHDVGGLSLNDFICAARIEALLQ
jgi:4a-hydroxytetrahydrobiopterin dehydratase